MSQKVITVNSESELKSLINTLAGWTVIDMQPDHQYPVDLGIHRDDVLGVIEFIEVMEV